MKKTFLGVAFVCLFLIVSCGAGDLKIKNQNNQGTSTSPFAISNLTPTVMTWPSNTIYTQPYSFRATGIRDSFYADVKVFRSGYGEILSVRYFGGMPLAGKWDTDIDGEMRMNTNTLASGATGSMTLQMFLTNPTETSNILTNTWRVN
jgi:hypothetical protein